MKVGFKHSTKEWDSYIDRVRREQPRRTKLLVAKTTQDLSRFTKASVPVRYKGIKRSVRPTVKDYTGYVSVDAHYAPYVEFGTGRLVNVPGELSQFAMQFKGRGIRQVNRRAEPYFYPHFFKQREKFFQSIESMMQRL